ncbi:LytR/AlgR family response regulator transcription factor [Pontibacter indicus]|uniref:Two component transcriptional regulator, LytTR family n=1 Tax=Pontibacter indicus TaxID=1317125 RepID=A0A1R3XTP8_9BACT|nr:LytTR family transcriptional regulator DNA-binding domain-containing protein [Pontibacter indicus]SIT95247.1 two component transcriptional regulator, LytTR family [Pontibacter indicus]
MITCYIVDDEAHAIQVLTRYIQQTPGLQLLGSEENPLLALDAITRGLYKPDIVFADVEMPQLSGVKLAELLAPHTRVVFTTAYSGFALDAFDRDAVDYLLKPILYERFLVSVTRIRERRNALSPFSGKEEAYCYVKGDSRGKLVRVVLSHIQYIQAMQNYLILHLRDKKVITYLTLQELEERLPAGAFTRVHKSFIVPYAKVHTVEGNQVILENQDVVPLGPSYREPFLQNVNARLIKSKRLP